MKFWKCSVCKVYVKKDVEELMSSIKPDDKNDSCMCMECFMKHGHFMAVMFDLFLEKLKKKKETDPELPPLDIENPEGKFKVFQALEQEEAIEYARYGGIAIHLHKFGVYEKSPKCFRDAIERGEDICHLFDQDRARLERTARSLGVRLIYIDKKGTDYQHIDLCGKPLEKLLEKVKQEKGLFDE